MRRLALLLLLPVLAAPLGAQRADTIPFSYGRGGKMYVQATVDGRGPLTLMFDTGADMVVLSRTGQEKVGRLVVDDSSSNGAFGGTITVRVSGGHAIAVGGMRQGGLSLLLIDGADADGILGHAVFAGRVVRIDHDRRELVVGDAVPPGAGSAVPIRREGGLLFVPATLAHGGRADTAWLELDTGAGWATYLPDAFAPARAIRATGEKLGERVSRGLGPGEVRTDLVRLDTMRIGGVTLAGVPVDVERPSGEVRRGDGILGMELLRRVNLVLDLRADRAYLAPSGAMDDRWRTGPPLGRVLAVAGAAMAALAGAGAWWRRRRRRRAA